MLSEILALVILFLIVILVIKFIFEHGSTILKIIMHLLAGWILLILVDILPGIDVPINLLTIIIAGFGGVLGTFILVLLSILI